MTLRKLAPADMLKALYWITPTLFLFWVFRYGLKSWFMADDFAWLALSQRVNNFHDFVQMMFEPMAQGTIRPWSERGFFMLFRTLFDLDGLPYRICVFATMSVNLLLITAVTFRLTRSRLAAFLAPVFWTVNEALVTVMTWNSSYNEAQCAAFLLGALLLFIRYAETGRSSLYFWSLLTFVLGFGSLEINVVFPAIALGYALFAAPGSATPRTSRRTLALSTFPFWLLSAVYYVIHRAVAPFLAKGPYALHIDGRMVRTLLRYAKWSLIPSTWDDMHYRHWVSVAILWVTAAGILLCLGRALGRRYYAPLVFVVWFLATIGPVVPLPDHISDYYLTIPTIGIAMLGAWSVAEGWQSPTPWKAVALLGAAAYFLGMLPITRFATRWWFERSHMVKSVVLGVRTAKENHPDKAILLDGITSELYNDAVGHSPFVLLGFNDVYLIPQLRDKIHPEDDLADLDDTVLAPGPTLRALANEQVVVYSLTGDHLRNITRTYGVAAALSLTHVEPRRIDVGNPLFAYLLGPEWLPIDTSFRWMPKSASLKLGGPRSRKAQLYLEGNCPISKLEGGSVHLEVTVDGIPLTRTQIVDPESNFHRLFVLPPQLIGKPVVEITIQTDRALRNPGQGELGLVFGKIAIREP